MCDLDTGDSCDVWAQRQVRALKAHRCSECDLPIVVGTVHVRTNMLYDGSWSSIRTHLDCLELTEFLAFDVCGQPSVILGGDLRERVREHLDEHIDVRRRWRRVLRARIREGVWPVRRAA